MNTPDIFEHGSQSPEMRKIATPTALTAAQLAAISAALNMPAQNMRSVRPPVRLRAARALGGSAVQKWQLETDRGPLFAKTGPLTQCFDAEALGLQVLADTIHHVGHPATVLQVAQPLAQGEFEASDAANCASFLVLNWFTFSDAAATPQMWSAAGAALAALHGVQASRAALAVQAEPTTNMGAPTPGAPPAGAPTPGARAWLTAHAAPAFAYGWHRDNMLGTTAQHNAPESRWATFWRLRRLKPQFALLRQSAKRGAQADAFLALAKREDALIAAADAMLASHRPAAALLHGDLWRGNLGFESRGRPVLYDPACWWGDAETDVAMAHLFGGMAPAFFAAYDAARPPKSGHLQRRALYQLYHVLNHANLFGGRYLAQAHGLIDTLTTPTGSPA